MGRRTAVTGGEGLGSASKLDRLGELVPLHPTPAVVTPWRWAYMFIGVACFGLGGIGAVVPGLPTTVFLLVGSYFLTRSCPWLEERMLQSSLLRPYASFIRSRDPMSVKSRVIALSCMWCSIVVSLAVLAFSEKLAGTRGAIVLSSVLGAGVVGTVAIVLFRRKGKDGERDCAGRDGASVPNPATENDAVSQN